MIKAYIVDDEILAIDNLRTIIEQNFKDVKIVGVSQTLNQAASEINLLHIDLLFLDIELKNGNGFDIYEKIENVSFRTIFVTAYSEYAVKAFKFFALDYLLKPIDVAELTLAIQKCKISLDDKSNLAAYYNEIKKQLSESALNYTNKIILKHQSGFDVLRYSEIMYIEADSSYCTFYCTNNKKIIYSKSSSEVEKMLPSNLFVRIHKSYIVNRSFIKDDTVDKKEITLTNGTVLPIARRRLEEVFSFLKKL